MNKFVKTAALTAGLGITLLAPSTVAAPSDVFIASNYTSVNVNSSAKVLSLTVPVGTYTVNAKVSLSNLDSDKQEAACQLELEQNDFSRILDDTGIVLSSLGDGGDQQSIALQGAFSSVPGPVRADPVAINVICRTFNAFAFQAVLTALKVDRVLTPPPDSYENPPAFSCGNVVICSFAPGCTWPRPG